MRSMLSMRGTLVLAALALLLAAAVCWTVASASALPAFWLANPLLAPHLIAGFSILLAAFATPFIFTETELSLDTSRDFAAKAAQAAAWLAIASAFMLLTTARVAPVSNIGIALAALWVFAVTGVTLLLHRTAPNAANAILFLWLFGLPISAYLIVEVFLTSPAGSSGLADSNAPQAAALRESVRWMLNLSPSTGTLGALTGNLADGTPFSPLVALSGVLLLALPCIAASGVFHREKSTLSVPLRRSAD